jgi:Leucine-rich repeat (LRR) protein
MAKLANFPALKTLWIQHSNVTGEGFKFLKEIPTLVTLNLDVNCGPAGLSGLAGMTSLERLYLWGGIKDEDLLSLPGLTNLKRLDIRRVDISDDGFRNLSKQRSLEKIYLDSPGITNAGLTYFEVLNSLKYIELFDTKITEQGLEKLKNKIPELEYYIH